MKNKILCSVFVISFNFVSSPLWAQETTQTALLPQVQIDATPEKHGFGDLSEEETPLSTVRISAEKMQENRIQRLSDVTLLDASTTDSYNATGYWDNISIRGFKLDSRTNYLREGLPISAETSIPLDNKEDIEILKGLGGVQVGASTPGGLVNYKVKRPTRTFQSTLHLESGERGSFLTAIDVGGPSQSFPAMGYRLNVAQEEMRPFLKNAQGSRSLVSLANEWRFSEGMLLESEVEWSRRSQPSQAGFSLLGSRLPAPVDPEINLNDQPWSQPVVFEGLTGTLRFTQILNTEWSWSVIAGVQNLKTDDRLAYPFGCSAENNFDRYCSNGTFDLYDYRSENEIRESKALKASLQGQAHFGVIENKFSFGVLGNTTRERYDRQVYNFVGTGTVDGATVTPENPTLSDENTNRDSANIDVFASNNLKWNRWNVWAGIRNSSLHRESIRTDGSRATDFHQNFVIPWGAIAYDFENMMIYASTGDGVESFVTPNKSGYDHPGEFVPDVISRQWEIGARGGSEIHWQSSLFQITRPLVVDQQPLYQIDGEEQHRGVEVQVAAEKGAWNFETSGMLLEALRKNSSLNPSLNDKHPVNVPSYTWRFYLGYKIPGFQNFVVNSRVTQEGPRAVVADNSIELPTWTRWDLGLTYGANLWKTKTLWRLSLENVTDARYWKESPEQYGHIYLYPGAERTLWLSLQASL